MRCDTDEYYAPPCNQPGEYSLKQTHFFSFLFLTSALMLGWVLWPFWQLLILAFLLAGVFRPAYKKLSLCMTSWTASFLKCALIVVAFFLLIEMDTLINFIRRLSPLPNEQNMLLVNKFTKIAGVILIGNGLSCILQGTLGGIFFAFLGLNSPVLWGVLMSILTFIPILGIGLVLLPAAVVLLSIFGGMSLFGVLGIVYGPLIVSLFLTLSEMYRNEYSQIKENRSISDNQKREEGLYARYPRLIPLAKETF